jgi:hypothetical protein
MLSAPQVMPATRQPTFSRGFTPARMIDTHLLTGRLSQARPLRQRHHWDQSACGTRFGLSNDA